MSDAPPKSPRKYPSFWEKAVPVFLAVLGIAVLILLIIIFGVASGMLGPH